MTGTEKQVAWAEIIISDAMGTIDKNITLTKERIEKYDMPDEAIRLKAWIAAKDHFGKILSTPEAQSASWIIDNRKGFDPAAIIHRVDEIVAAEKRNNR